MLRVDPEIKIKTTTLFFMLLTVRPVMLFTSVVPTHKCFDELDFVNAQLDSHKTLFLNTNAANILGTSVQSGWTAN